MDEGDGIPAPPWGRGRTLNGQFMSTPMNTGPTLKFPDSQSPIEPSEKKLKLSKGDVVDSILRMKDIMGRAMRNVDIVDDLLVQLNVAPKAACSDVENFQELKSTYKILSGRVTKLQKAMKSRDFYRSRCKYNDPNQTNGSFDVSFIKRSELPDNLEVVPEDDEEEDEVEELNLSMEAVTVKTGRTKKPLDEIKDRKHRKERGEGGYQALLEFSKENSISLLKAVGFFLQRHYYDIDRKISTFGRELYEQGEGAFEIRTLSVTEALWFIERIQLGKGRYQGAKIFLKDKVKLPPYQKVAGLRTSLCTPLSEYNINGEMVGLTINLKEALKMHLTRGLEVWNLLLVENIYYVRITIGFDWLVSN